MTLNKQKQKLYIYWEIKLKILRALNKLLQILQEFYWILVKLSLLSSRDSQIPIVKESLK